MLTKPSLRNKVILPFTQVSNLQSYVPKWTIRIACTAVITVSSLQGTNRIQKDFSCLPPRPVFFLFPSSKIFTRRSTTT